MENQYKKIRIIPDHTVKYLASHNIFEDPDKAKQDLKNLNDKERFSYDDLCNSFLYHETYSSVDEERMRKEYFSEIALSGLWGVGTLNDYLRENIGGKRPINQRAIDAGPYSHGVLLTSLFSNFENGGVIPACDFDEENVVMDYLNNLMEPLWRIPGMMEMGEIDRENINNEKFRSSYLQFLRDMSTAVPRIITQICRDPNEDLSEANELIERLSPDLRNVPKQFESYVIERIKRERDDPPDSMFIDGFFSVWEALAKHMQDKVTYV